MNKRAGQTVLQAETGTADYLTASWLIFLQFLRPTSSVHQSQVRQEVEHKRNIWKKWEYLSFSGPNAKSSRYTIDVLAESISVCRLLDSL